MAFRQYKKGMITKEDRRQPRPYRDPNNKVTRPCEGPGCSAIVTSYLSSLNTQRKLSKAKEPGRFCSQACYNQHRREHPRVRTQKIT